MVSQRRVELRSQGIDDFSRFGVTLVVASAGHDLDDRIHEGDGKVCIGGCVTVAEQTADARLTHSFTEAAILRITPVDTSPSERVTEPCKTNCTPVRVGNDDDPKLRLTCLSIVCTSLAGSQLTPRTPSTNAVALVYASFETEPTPSGSARISRGLSP
jgi:hypothetical protein